MLILIKKIKKYAGIWEMGPKKDQYFSKKLDE